MPDVTQADISLQIMQRPLWTSWRNRSSMREKSRGRNNNGGRKPLPPSKEQLRVYTLERHKRSEKCNAIPFVGFLVTYHERFRHNATMCLDTASLAYYSPIELKGNPPKRKSVHFCETYLVHVESPLPS